MQMSPSSYMSTYYILGYLFHLSKDKGRWKYKASVKSLKKCGDPLPKEYVERTRSEGVTKRIDEHMKSMGFPMTNGVSASYL